MTERHVAVYIDRREQHPEVTVSDTAAGIRVGTYTIKTVADLINLAGVIVYGEQPDDLPSSTA